MQRIERILVSLREVGIDWEMTADDAGKPVSIQLNFPVQNLLKYDMKMVEEWTKNLRSIIRELRG
jgi:hypothetical protein